MNRNNGLRLEYVAHMSLVRASAGRGRLLDDEPPLSGLLAADAAADAAVPPRRLPLPPPLLLVLVLALFWVAGDPRPSSPLFSCRSSFLVPHSRKANA